jgi:hypothetical protein
MSLKKRIQETKREQGLFVVLAGPRLGGKTTTLGTLPGKTLLLEVADKESGSLGAVNMAKSLGNNLEVVRVHDCADIQALVEEALTLDYDNIAIDGISALTEVECEKPKVKKMLEGASAKWDGWKIMGDTIVDLLQYLKHASRASGKTIVATMALKEKFNPDGVVVTTEMDAKGNMTETFIKGKCPYYVVARLAADAEGNPLRILQTYNDGVYTARLDGIFDSNNPKGFRSDPTKVEQGQDVGLAAMVKYLRSNME